MCIPLTVTLTAMGQVTTRMVRVTTIPGITFGRRAITRRRLITIVHRPHRAAGGVAGVVIVRRHRQVAGQGRAVAGKGMVIITGQEGMVQVVEVVRAGTGSAVGAADLTVG